MGPSRVAYHLEIEHEAAKSLVRMARGDRAGPKRVNAAIKSLAENPRPAGATKLVGKDAWRLRVGDYRVVYVIEDAIRVVIVTRIGHRRDVYER
jgi:mRNA interferase RelE/StbE